MPCLTTSQSMVEYVGFFGAVIMEIIAFRNTVYEVRSEISY